MPEDNAAIVILLKGLRPFEGLSDAQLAQVAAATSLLEMKEGESIAFPEERDFPFYAIATGKVRQTLQTWRKEKPVLALKKHDFFGADVTILGHRRWYAVTAAKPTQLLKIESGQLALLLRAIPRLKENLHIAVHMYHLIHSKRFDWLGEDENVLLVTHKHPAHLVVALIGPLGLFGAASLLFLFSVLISNTGLRLVMGWLSLGFFIAGLLWAAWDYIDHLNDYYVVSEERVVWLESVIGLYDSRNEALR
jgi:hypothetical protein